jgi:hypothetical protein
MVCMRRDTAQQRAAARFADRLLLLFSAVRLIFRLSHAARLIFSRWPALMILPLPVSFAFADFFAAGRHFAADMLYFTPSRHTPPQLAASGRFRHAAFRLDSFRLPPLAASLRYFRRFSVFR